MSINRTQDTVRSHYTWGTQDRFETTRSKRMRPRPVLIWDRGRDQDQLLWDRDRDRDQKSGLETTLVSRP